MVSPNNGSFISDKKRKIIKQQWFGRFLLRDNTHIANTIGLEKWFHILLKNYDNWTSIEHLSKYEPINIYLLDCDEYLTDIIPLIYNAANRKE